MTETFWKIRVLLSCYVGSRWISKSNQIKSILYPFLCVLKHFNNGNAVPMRSSSFSTMGTAFPRVPPRNDPWFRCPSDISITSWLFTAWWLTWPGNYLVPCVAELVGSCIPIHAHRCLPDPNCLFYPFGLSLCLSVDHYCLVPVDDMVLFHYTH